MTCNTILGYLREKESAVVQRQIQAKSVIHDLVYHGNWRITYYSDSPTVPAGLPISGLKVHMMICELNLLLNS